MGGAGGRGLLSPDSTCTDARVKPGHHRDRQGRGGLSSRLRANGTVGVRGWGYDRWHRACLWRRRLLRCALARRRVLSLREQVVLQHLSRQIAHNGAPLWSLHQGSSTSANIRAYSRHNSLWSEKMPGVVPRMHRHSEEEVIGNGAELIALVCILLPWSPHLGPLCGLRVFARSAWHVFLCLASEGNLSTPFFQISAQVPVVPVFYY